jgi:hypothetical protein
VRPALLLPLLSLACNNPPPPTTPDLPQVSLLVEEPNSVGKSIKLTIATSGCDQVQGLELFDGTEPLKQVASGGTSTPVVEPVNSSAQVVDLPHLAQAAPLHLERRARAVWEVLHPDVPGLAGHQIHVHWHARARTGRPFVGLVHAINQREGRGGPPATAAIGMNRGVSLSHPSC